MSRRLLTFLAALAAVLAPSLVLVAGAATPARAAGTGSITGTVTVPAGYDVRVVQVVVVSASDPAYHRVATDWTEPDGSFAVTGLPTGSYYVGYGTSWSDMNTCDGRDRWWSGPGAAPAGVCAYDGGIGALTITGAAALSVTDGAATGLESVPLLTSFPTYPYTGKVAAPAGHTTAGVVAELWREDGGAWYPQVPGGWYRVAGVPAQTLDATGTFEFDLISPPWEHRYAVRFVDEPGHGYAFSFATGGLSSVVGGAGGTGFGAGSIGLLDLGYRVGAGHDAGTYSFGFEVGHASGGVTLTGAPEWGRTLTAHSDVVWSDPTVGTRFQWYRNGVAVDGATAPTYVLNGMDDGWEVGISVRAVPAPGWAYNGAPIDSPTVVVENTTPLAVAPPTVTGTVAVGRRLTATAGSWRPTAPTYSHTWRWFRGATPIPGATSATYVVTPADLGARLRVEVTADHPTWFSGPGTSLSSQTPVVAPGTIPAAWITRWPVRSGTPRVGRTVGVTAPAYSADGRAHRLRATYRWYVGGRAVAGATTRQLVLRRAWRGRTVAVRVAVGTPGYRATYRTLSFGRVRSH